MSKHKILVALQALYPHCTHYMGRTPDQVATFLSGYLGVLEREFGDLNAREEVGGWVEMACNDWLGRLSEHNQKFPGADQVRDLARAFSIPKERGGNTQSVGWKELSEEEYDSLTMEKKARYCTIMADEYGKLAGPMLTKDKGSGPAFPDRFAKFIPVYNQYRSEAERLMRALAKARSDRPSTVLPSDKMTQAIKLVFQKQNQAFTH